MENKMTLKDYDEHKKVQPETQLSYKANQVLTYLEIKHKGNKGKFGNAHMNRMHLALDIIPREIRTCIREIIEKGKAVIGNRNGYYLCVTAEEVEHANDHEVSRIISSIKRLAQNKGSFGKIFSELNQLKLKYPHIADGQLNINGEIEKKTLT